MILDEDGKPTPKKINGETTDEKCPKCGSPMVRKAGKRGPFFACSAYPKCKTAMSIGEDGKPVERGKARKTTGKKTAGKKTATRNTTRKKTAPDAIGTSKPPPEPTDYDCPECGKKLVIRKGRYGQFFGCSGYPKCKTTLKVDQDGKPVEK